MMQPRMRVSNRTNALWTNRDTLTKIGSRCRARRTSALLQVPLLGYESRTMQPDQSAVPANELLRLAEKADGRRGVTQTMVRITEKSGVRYDVLTDAELDVLRSSGATIETLMKIDAVPVHPKRAAREKETVVVVHVPGAKPKKYNASEVDALFLTESAVQKFVLPYYARTLTATAYTTLLARYYNSASPAWALIHFPTSQYDVLEGDV